MAHASNVYLMLVVLSYALGSIAAGVIGALIARDAKNTITIGAGLIFMALGVINLASFHHPTWFWVASLAVYLPFTWIGTLFIKRKY